MQPVDGVFPGSDMHTMFMMYLCLGMLTYDDLLSFFTQAVVPGVAAFREYIYTFVQYSSCSTRKYLYIDVEEQWQANSCYLACTH